MGRFLPVFYTLGYKKGTYGRVSEGSLGQVSVWILSMTRSPFRAGVAHLLDGGNSMDSCDDKNEDPDICRELVRIFGQDLVDVEWSVCDEASDDMVGYEGERVRYCPEIDFIVGPLNITKDEDEIRRMNEDYDDLYDEFEELFRTLYNRDVAIEKEVSKTLSNDENECEKLLLIERGVTLRTNDNPRCFIAIEYERNTKEKHVLGGLIHASALGKVGVILTPNATSKQYKRAMKIRRYLRFLVQVGKLGENTKLELNTILLPRNEFLRILRGYQHHR